ncbi:acyl-CoA dehydrogenase family protein [Burkholderia sp. BDU5]|uniref:acyl-CoA dehydrogenase family protein n=1 Tax=Burkholderia sp. BDU5 TaxID=1385590 RepID=UPI000752E9D3|nr:isovaleryl-CoA dehydrogenase [Burkholderia sp. BDU5]
MLAPQLDVIAPGRPLLRHADGLFELPPPEDATRDAASRWVDRFSGDLLDKVSNEAGQLDRDGATLRREVMTEAARRGLLGASLPRHVGGLGMSLLGWGHALERVGYLCDDASFALNISLFQSVANMLVTSGNAGLIERYVAPVCTGERLAAFAYTEEADAFSMKSTLRAHHGDYLVNGAKVMVTAGAMADSYMTYVMNEATDDMAVVMIDRDAPGVHVQPIETMGLRASGLAAVRFDSVRVPKEQLLLAENGLDHVQNFLNPRRGILCCAPIGRMQRIVDECVKMLSETVRHGAPLTSMQLIQARLGRMQMKVHISKALVDPALDWLDQNAANNHLEEIVSAAKHEITEHAIAVALDSIRLTGARGYAHANQFERYLRDFCGLISGAGSQDVLEVNMGLLAVARAAGRTTG